MGDPREEFLKVARGMYAQARAEFRQMADPLVEGDPEGQRFVASLEQAIGECSPDQAVDALIRWLDEREQGGCGVGNPL